jgi:minor extracellular protease Epr
MLVAGCNDENDWSRQYQIKIGTKISDQKTVKIAILDSGVNANIPTMKDAITASYNVLNPEKETDDIFNHGTKIASVISDSEVGMSQHVELYDIQVLNDGGQGSLASICKGISRALEENADIINMSLGFNQDIPGLKECIGEAITKDVIVVASAGDSLSHTSNYPADYDEVISVAAINEDEQFYRFSSKGKIDFVAPGVNVAVRDKNGEVMLDSGSSIAVANFTAVLALYLGDGTSKEDIFSEKNFKYVSIDDVEYKSLYYKGQ